MTLSITTPILLFPAISLILLAYTAKFAHLANLTRNLNKQYAVDETAGLLHQIKNLRERIYLIKNMQMFGTGSFCLCIISIFMLFNNWILAGQISFWLSTIAMMVALYFSLKEIWLSTDALKVVVNEVYKR